MPPQNFVCRFTLHNSSFPLPISLLPFLSFPPCSVANRTFLLLFFLVNLPAFPLFPFLYLFVLSASHKDSHVGLCRPVNAGIAFSQVLAQMPAVFPGERSRRGRAARRSKIAVHRGPRALLERTNAYTVKQRRKRDAKVVRAGDLTRPCRQRSLSAPQWPSTRQEGVNCGLAQGCEKRRGEIKRGHSAGSLRVERGASAKDGHDVIVSERFQGEAPTLKKYSYCLFIPVRNVH